MNLSLRTLLTAAALITAPLALRAADDAKACAADSAGCSAAKTAACCSSAKQQHMSLKLKSAGGGDPQTALAKVKGVSGVETCSDSKFTTVAFDKEVVREAKIRSALKKAGYQIEAQRVTYAVQGIACGSCADKISTALSKVKGVSETKVCSESKTATIDFDPAKVSAGKIMAAISGAGFKATESVN